MWAILKFLFNFDMFSYRYWHHLMQAELHGFPGFVFGILVLAALPLYIATTTLIIRTKKPLVTVPVPTPIKKVWTKMQPTLINPPTPAPAPDEEKKSEQAESTVDTLPDELPSELRTAYIRARMNITPDQRSAFNQPTTPPLPDIATTHTNEAPIESELDEIPLPSDFDVAPFESSEFEMPDFTQMSAPTFSEITFGDTPPPETKFQNAVTEHLDTIGQEYETQDNIIITDKFAIASHTDPDFWVCDNESWFATGKQIPSPIISVTRIASEHGLIPVLYLGTDNIMDLDNMCQKWASDGIKIITSPDELFK